MKSKLELLHLIKQMNWFGNACYFGAVVFFAVALSFYFIGDITGIGFIQIMVRSFFIFLIGRGFKIFIKGIEETIKEL